MKKRYWLICMMVLCGLLAGCRQQSDKKEVTLIRDASLDSVGGIMLYEYADGEVTERYLTELLACEELLDYFNSCEVVEVDAPDLEQLEGSLYGIQVPQSNHDYGDKLMSGWQDGYWFDESGRVYQVDINFEQIIQDYPWEIEQTVPVEESYWGLNLGWYGGKWYPEFLAEQAFRSGNEYHPWPEPTPTEYADWPTSELVQLIPEYESYPVGTEEFYCFIQNNSEEDIECMPEVKVEVLLEGEWQQLSDKYHTPYNNLVWRIGASSENDLVVDLDRYAWDFTEGKYRVCFIYCVEEFNPRFGQDFDHVAYAEFEVR